MKIFYIIPCIAMAALVHLSCGRSDFASALPGKWQLTGDACDTGGSCSKEIMTDEGNGDTFTRDGFYVTQRSRNGYSLNGRTIRFATTKNMCGMIEAEIVSLSGDDLLLQCGNRIRRFNRVRTR